MENNLDFETVLYLIWFAAIMEGNILIYNHWFGDFSCITHLN